LHATIPIIRLSTLVNHPPPIRTERPSLAVVLVMSMVVVPVPVPRVSMMAPMATVASYPSTTNLATAPATVTVTITIAATIAAAIFVAVDAVTARGLRPCLFVRPLQRLGLLRRGLHLQLHALVAPEAALPGALSRWTRPRVLRLQVLPEVHRVLYSVPRTAPHPATRRVGALTVILLLLPRTQRLQCVRRERRRGRRRRRGLGRGVHVVDFLVVAGCEEVVVVRE
jgi:hypothetical protein